jgi:hypothetical protein
MSVATMLERVTNRPNSFVTREGKDLVVYISPKVVTGAMLAVAAGAGALMACDTTGIVALSDNARLAADTVFSLALWFPLNHHRGRKQQKQTQPA